MKIRCIVRNKKSSARNHALRFTKRVLGKSKSNSMCFTICYPLSLFLKGRNINCSLKAGLYNSAHNNHVHHFWLACDEINQVIIDPTIRQFHKNESRIYFGPITIKYNEVSFDFISTYKEWKATMENGFHQNLIAMERVNIRKAYRRASKILKKDF